MILNMKSYLSLLLSFVFGPSLGIHYDFNFKRNPYVLALILKCSVVTGNSATGGDDKARK